jgi:hypothetical protein
MIIYVAWPTNDMVKSNATAKAWADLRYNVAVASEVPVALENPAKDVVAHRVFKLDQYPGYYNTMNLMCQWLVKECKADIVVCAGDGILPPQGYPAWAIGGMFAQKFPNGFGVMQPVGAKWAANDSPRQYNFHDLPDSTQRCESPWIGGPFIRQAYGGQGPYGPGYRQYWGDAELCEVARRWGVLWRNEDLAQRWDHWSRAGGPEGTAHQKDSYVRNYENDCAHFRSRRYRGFPGSEQREQSNIIVPDASRGIITP